MKRHIDFFKLEELMKEKINKNLWNVETCWINMLSPTKKVMAVYMPLLAKMAKDTPSIMFAKMNFEFFCGIIFFIFLSFLLPMLETIHDALPSPGVNPLEGSPKGNCGKRDSEGAPSFQL